MIFSVVAVLLFSMLSACGGSKNEDAGDTNQKAQEGAAEKPVTINMFTNMPEYTDAFHAYIEEYKKVKPNVTINLEIMQADYPTVLKSKIASGNIPDVFTSTAGGEIAQYAEYSADLTNEPLAAAMTDSVRNNMSLDGKVLGLPVKGNVFALLYNKKLFAEAGISAPPKTFAELNDDIAKLEAKGIKPFTNAYKEWWVFKHIFQHFIDASTDNPQQLVNDFIAGKTHFSDHPELLKFFDFIDTTVAHGMDKPLERDLNAEIADFATGKAAMMTGQGAWVEEGILKIDPNFQIGVAGYPVGDDANKAMIITGADQAIRINKDSPVAKEAIDFFNWLYTSDYGKKWFSQVAKVIPPIKDAPMPDLQIPKAMNEILQTEPSGDLAINYSLDSFHQKFGEIIQAYIGKVKTREQAIDEIEKAWVQLGAAK
ncbi:MAG TPA: extracellular solute-binding protein [Bacilli bacterium]